MRERIASPERAIGSQRLHTHTACRTSLPARRQACPVNFVICLFVGRCCAGLIVRICSEFSRYWVFRSNRKVKRKPERKMKRKVDRKVTPGGDCSGGRDQPEPYARHGELYVRHTIIYIRHDDFAARTIA
jgi:hypothetical protein